MASEAVSPSVSHTERIHEVTWVTARDHPSTLIIVVMVIIESDLVNCGAALLYARQTVQVLFFPDFYNIGGHLGLAGDTREAGKG